MELRPVPRRDAPRYPTARRGCAALVPWLRRTVASVGLSAAIAGLGCVGGGSGFLVEPEYFACSPGARQIDDFDALGTGSYSGLLCAAPATSRGGMRVEVATTLRFELVDGLEKAVVRIVDSAGGELAVLDLERPAADVELEPGAIEVIVEALGGATGWFGIAISPVP